MAKFDFSQADIRLEQQSGHTIGVIDVQKRPWSLHFQDVPSYEKFLMAFLEARCHFMDKSWTFFVMSKKEDSEEKIRNGSRIRIKYEQESHKLQVDPDSFRWHEALLGLDYNCIIMMYGKTTEDFGDIVDLIGFGTMTFKLEILGKISEPLKTAKESVKPNATSIEEIIEDKTQPSKAKEFKTSAISTKVQPEKLDLVNMIITENRLQNTELRMSMMKISEKMDSLLLEYERKNPTSHANLQDSSSKDSAPAEVNVKKAMNRLYKVLKNRIEPTKTYNGEEVLDILVESIKSSTESVLSK